MFTYITDIENIAVMSIINLSYLLLNYLNLVWCYFLLNSVLCGVFIFLCLLATIFELIKDYKEHNEVTLEISNEFSMAKENEKTPLLYGNEKSDIPEIEHQSKGMFCYKRTVFLGSIQIQMKGEKFGVLTTWVLNYQMFWFRPFSLTNGRRSTL